MEFEEEESFAVMFADSEKKKEKKKKNSKKQLKKLCKEIENLTNRVSKLEYANNKCVQKLMQIENIKQNDNNNDILLDDLDNFKI